MERARVIIQVVAGIIPERPIDEYSKTFTIGSDMWYAQGKWEGKQDEAAAKCREIQQQASEYQLSLWNPQGLNWVRCDWIYL